jgi:hypothetical protein
MLYSQRGISLIQVAIVMASLAAIAMAALYGMRYERNPLLDGLDKLSGHPAGQAAIQKTQQVLRDSGVSPAAGAAPAGVLRKCVINGKTVFSDVECNEHGQVVKVHETHGYEAPKVAAPDPAASAPQSVQDQAIEKATR